MADGPPSLFSFGFSKFFTECRTDAPCSFPPFLACIAFPLVKQTGMRESSFAPLFPSPCCQSGKKRLKNTPPFLLFPLFLLCILSFPFFEEAVLPFFFYFLQLAYIFGRSSCFSFFLEDHLPLLLRSWLVRFTPLEIVGKVHGHFVSPPPFPHPQHKDFPFAFFPFPFFSA